MTRSGLKLAVHGDDADPGDGVVPFVVVGGDSNKE